MNKCPNCHKKTDSIKSVIQGGKILTGCPSCLGGHIQGNPSAAKYYREWQKTEYRKDLTQPGQGRDFVRAYGVEKSREYMDDETIRKLA